VTQPALKSLSHQGWSIKKMAKDKKNITTVDEAQKLGDTNLKSACRFIIKQASKRFYGRVTLIFEDGQIRRVIEESSYFPPFE
jgi:hypothetical protein